jgi:hypothetical protein
MRIEVSSLPFLPFAQRGYLPVESGIYIFCRGTQVLYVGQSVNIQRRVATHNRRSQLQDTDRISYRLVELGSLREVERYYILLLQPSLNGSPDPVAPRIPRRTTLALRDSRTRDFFLPSLSSFVHNRLLLRAFCISCSKSYLAQNILIDRCDRIRSSIDIHRVDSQLLVKVLTEWSKDTRVIGLINHQMDFYASEYSLTLSELTNEVIAYDSEGLSTPQIHEAIACLLIRLPSGRN